MQNAECRIQNARCHLEPPDRISGSATASPACQRAPGGGPPHPELERRPGIISTKQHVRKRPRETTETTLQYIYTHTQSESASNGHTPTSRPHKEHADSRIFFPPPHIPRSCSTTRRRCAPGHWTARVWIQITSQIDYQTIESKPRPTRTQSQNTHKHGDCWSMVDGRWSMVDGRWSMVDG
jgi:hypothetical protein